MGNRKGLSFDDYRIKMVLYQYSQSYPHQSEGEYTFPFGGTEEYVLANFSGLTKIPPLPKVGSPHVWVCFDPSTSQWHYREIYHRLICEANDLDDVLDYKALRRLEYPPETDFLDGQAKGDEAQLLAYYEACRRVKLRYPKNFVPITRRDYLVKKIGLRTEKEVKDFQIGDDTISIVIPTLSKLEAELNIVKDGVGFLKEDIDTLKVARTLAKSEITKLKKEVQATNKRIEDLPAYEVQTETERIKANLATTNDRLTTLQNSLDMVISALRKRYIM
jgi:hypothetical protein